MTRFIAELVLITAISFVLTGFIALAIIQKIY